METRMQHQRTALLGSVTGAFSVLLAVSCVLLIWQHHLANQPAHPRAARSGSTPPAATATFSHAPGTQPATPMATPVPTPTPVAPRAPANPPPTPPLHGPLIFYDNFSGTALSSPWTIVTRHGEYAQSTTQCNVPGPLPAPHTIITIS